MKRYTARQFKLDNHTIPNLPSEYSIVLVEGPDFHGQRYYSLRKNGVECVAFRTNPWDNSFRITSVNATDILVDNPNLNTEELSGSNMALIYLDDLYYTYNPVKIAQNNGKVYSKTFVALRDRLSSSRDWARSKLTKKMLETVSNYIKNKVGYIKPELTLNTFEFNQYCNTLPDVISLSYVGFDSWSGNIITYPKYHYTSKGKVYVTSEAQAATFGLRQENFAGRSYWLEPDEFLMEGEIVSLRDGSEVCPDCGTEVPVSYMEVDATDGHRCCKRCANATYEIHNYSTRVPSLLKFKAKKVLPSTIYLGCELEYETTNRDEARVKVGRALRNHAIMKSDGSIRNGFEVVTCPATLEIHLDIFKKFFENRPAELTVASNVGMHVHVSRKPLSVLTVGKMTEFMNRPDNVKFITHIAGRAPNNYCRQDNGRSLSFPLTSSQSERYNTLNLNNRETVEFRIFSTPLTYEDFAHKVQFCQALTEYSKPGVLDVPLKEQTSYTHFIKWALANHRDFPELATKIKSFSA